MPALLALLTLSASLTFPASAQDSLEYRVKAAFLFNFAKFIEWPQGESEEFVIAVLGQDPFGPVLEATLAGKEVGGLPIAVRRIESLEGPDVGQILFVSRSEDEIVAEHLARLGTGVLTVGESKPFARAGGMVNFVLRDGKVRFEIDATSAEESGIKISSKLLSVAVAVR